MSLIPLGILASSLPSGGNALTLISTQVLTGAASSISFNSISSSFKHLQLRIVARTDRSLQLDGCILRFNGDTGSNYAYHKLYAAGVGVTSAGWNSETKIAQVFVAGNTAASNAFGGGTIDILDYSLTSKNTTVRTFSGASVDTYPYFGLGSGVWLNSAAITSITIGTETGPNFLAGSRFSLYGVS